MNLYRTALLSFSLTAVVLAQETTVGTSPMMPANPRCEVVIDFAALRESGLLDDLKASMIGMFLAKAEEDAGMKFASIQKVRMYPQIPDGAPGAANQPRGGVAFLDGDEKLTLPKEKKGMQAGKVGDHDALVQGGGGENSEMMVSMKPGSLVVGTGNLVEPLVTGKQKSGTLPAELKALQGGKGVLVNAAVLVPETMPGDMAEMFESTGKPQGAVMRLVNSQVAEEDHFAIEILVRFPSEEKGAKELIEMAKMQLQALTQMGPMAQMKELKDLVGKLEFTAEGKDAKVKLPLGTSRDMVAAMTALMPMMTMGQPRPGQGR